MRNSSRGTHTHVLAGCISAGHVLLPGHAASASASASALLLFLLSKYLYSLCQSVKAIKCSVNIKQDCGALSPFLYDSTCHPPTPLALLWLASESGKGGKVVCSEHVSCFRARAMQTTATIRIIHAFNFRLICSTNFMHRKETLISLSLSLTHSAESKPTEQQTKCSTFLHNHLLS